VTQLHHRLVTCFSVFDIWINTHFINTSEAPGRAVRNTDDFISFMLCLGPYSDSPIGRLYLGYLSLTFNSAIPTGLKYWISQRTSADVLTHNICQTTKGHGGLVLLVLLIIFYKILPFTADDLRCPPTKH